MLKTNLTKNPAMVRVHFCNEDFLIFWLSFFKMWEDLTLFSTVLIYFFLIVSVAWFSSNTSLSAILCINYSESLANAKIKSDMDNEL